MISSSTASLDRDERLVAELHRLGVRHLMRLKPDQLLTPLDPVDLVASLAQHEQARFRAALILLFLRRPSFSQFVPEALRRLDERAANTLRLNYQAAAYLRSDLEPDLVCYSDDLAFLPDLFSTELGLPEPGGISTDAGLAALGELHESLSGWPYNWSGSYRQNIPLFLRQLRRYASAALQP